MLLVWSISDIRILKIFEVFSPTEGIPTLKDIALIKADQ